MRIYLDNCCFNRPYDDQTQLRISLEAQAKLGIQELIKNGSIDMASSYMSTYENDLNPYDIRREYIQGFLEKYSAVYVHESMEDDVSTIAENIEETGIKYKDARHIACAILAECDYFVTTDDRVLKYRSDEIEVINPLNLISFLEVE